MRLVRYTLDDPARPGHGAEHRLVTSLLNPRVAPAEELVLAYHARWEFELAADEVKTHQRPATPLRSKKPVGVVQEIYALLLAHYVKTAHHRDRPQPTKPFRDAVVLLIYPTFARIGGTHPSVG